MGETGQPKRDSLRTLTLALVIAGVALRLWWVALSHTGTRLLHLGEASEAALALARTGTIADAFFAGQGPTAHLMPTMLVLSASVLRTFGPPSPAAALVLTAWALTQVFAGYWLARRLFATIGAGPGVLAGGLAVLCLVPAFVAQECADFRFWEAGLASAMALLNLWLIATLSQRPVPNVQPLLVAATLAAATFFVSPTTGVAVYACWGAFTLRLPRPLALRFAAAGAAALALCLAPWMLRNTQQLGHPILLRSNFGLEIALANHPAAVSGVDALAVQKARMRGIHPFASREAEARLRAAGGEVAYAQALGRVTWHWAAAHPLDFARLTLRHYRQFYLPDRWQGALTNWPVWEMPRIDAIRTIALLGLAGLALGLARRRRFYPMLALYMTVAGLPYALVQPIPRYAYGLWPLYAFLAAQLLADLATLLRRRSATPITRS